MADPQIEAILKALAGGGAATGTVTWTPPGVAQAPPGGVTEAMLGRLGFAGGVPRAPVNLPADQLGPILGSLSAADLDQVRRQLYSSGLMPDRFYGARAQPMPFGQGLDADTAAAFRSAVSLAQFTGNLDQLLAAKPSLAAIGAQGPTRQPLVIELPSETDLHAVLKEAAMPLIGRDPTPEEMTAFAKRFREQAATYQRQAYAAGGAGLPGGLGGTVQRPPAASVAAQEFLKREAPVEAGAQKMEQGLGILVKMFAGGGV